MINFLYSLMAVELFTGGGGRLLGLGPVTLRMGLFSVALLATLIMYRSHPEPDRLKSLPVLLVLGFLGTHLPSVFVGLDNGASYQDLFVDISPMLFWLAAPFFACVLKSDAMVQRTAALIQWCAIGLAVVYLFVFVALATGMDLFEGFHQWAENTGEISFRNHQMFFYKGFFYLGIGTVFLVSLGSRWQAVWLAAIVVAMTLTMTRGFVLATSAAIFLLLVTMQRKRALYIALCVMALVMYAVWIYLPSLDDGHMLVQRGISNSIRIMDFSFIQRHFDISSLAFGEGMGTYINGRLSIENSYLTIFWKMGLVALLFWLLPIGIGLYYFLEVSRNSAAYSLACAFFFGMVFVYVQTVSNPYLNNPIGLSFVMMAIFSLRTLASMSSFPLKPLHKSVTQVAS
ncbi:MAG: hypothetical protein HQ446_14210 [Polaromonas sp.]|nr:hypothetical protein [Polaromonas sp.]